MEDVLFLLHSFFSCRLLSAVDGKVHLHTWSISMQGNAHYTRTMPAPVPNEWQSERALSVFDFNFLSHRLANKNGHLQFSIQATSNALASKSIDWFHLFSISLFIFASIRSRWNGKGENNLYGTRHMHSITEKSISEHVQRWMFRRMFRKKRILKMN